MIGACALALGVIELPAAVIRLSLPAGSDAPPCDRQRAIREFVGVSGTAEGLAQLPDGRFQPPMALNVVEQHLREGIDARWPNRRLTIGRTANLTVVKDGRSACQYRSICARGCSYGAYRSTQSARLPAAMATGRLTLVTDSVVDEVDHDPFTRRATGVRFLDTGTGVLVQRAGRAARQTARCSRLQFPRKREAQG